MESENETTEVNTKAQLQLCDLGISMTRRAWTKLMAYCRATNLETSGFMLLERDGSDLMIDEIYLLPQESTGTSTEMDRTAIAKFQLDLYKKGIIGKKDSKKRLAHWHTHPTFGVFWSGTDMEMRRLNSQGVDYFVSIVVNQKGDALAAIDIKGEFPVAINDLPIEIVDNDDVAELIKACKAEVELKVKSPTHTWGGTGGPGGYHGYQGYSAKEGRTYFNPETGQWQEQPVGAPERLVLTNDTPPTDEQRTSRAASSYIEELKLLGPMDRRTRKAVARVERLTKIISKTAGTISYPEWKKHNDRLDAARVALRDLVNNIRGKKPAPPTGVLAGGDEGEITIVSDDEPIRITDTGGKGRDEGELWSDEKGTWQNIGGEIVKIDEPMMMD